MDTDQDVAALRSAMRRQAEAERDRIAAEAEAEIRSIRAQTEAEVEAVKAEAMAQVDRDVAAESDRVLGHAKMERRNERLSVKRRVIRQAFDRAGETIRAMQDRPERRQVLGALIAEAVASAGEGAEVTVAECEADLCRAAVAQQGIACTLRPVAETPGTVIARSADHARRVDNSLQTRLARAEVLAVRNVSAVLFGSRATGVGAE